MQATSRLTACLAISIYCGMCELHFGQDLGQISSICYIIIINDNVMSVIYPNSSYDDSSSLCGLAKLSCRREEACKKLFNEIVNIRGH